MFTMEITKVLSMITTFHPGALNTYRFIKSMCFSNHGYDQYRQSSIECPPTCMSSDSYGTPHPSSVGPPDSDPKEIRQRNYVYAEIDRYRIREMYHCTSQSPAETGKFVLILFSINT